jgi:hypothetical protein
MSKEATTVYKMRHKTTGLFYTSAKRGYNKTNFSFSGKIYTSKYPLPSGNMYINLMQIEKFNIPAELLSDSYCTKNAKLISTNKRDWEYVEFELIELNN